MGSTANSILNELRAAKSEVDSLLRAENYAEAIVKSEAMYRLATSLPIQGSPAEIENLTALTKTHHRMTEQVTAALNRFQAIGRKRQKAISGYRMK